MRDALLANAKADVLKGVNATNLNTGGNLETFIGNAANLLIFVVGAVSVIMIIVGGLRLALSGGNPQNVKTARETVLYAAAGVAVALAAYAIVNLVIQQFG